MSNETRKKISVSAKGRKFTEEHKKRIGESNKGKKMPLEFGQKVAERNKARKGNVKESTKQKMSVLMTGSRNPKASLTEEKVSEIKVFLRNRPIGMSNKQVAEKFGLKRYHIENILYLGRWRHVV